MSINPKFILASDLMEYFVDKLTGAPLAAGVITFYSDVNRNTLKSVYQISTTDAPYTYTALTNPITLSANGTFQDSNGNNIVPYYYPYQGAPADNDTEIELYYITVDSAGGTRQFDRVAWPNFSGGGNVTNQSDQKNYIPNGQFLSHNTIVSETVPPQETVQFGAGTITAQPIAQGGWAVWKPTGSTATYSNSFADYVIDATLKDHPRFVFNFNCTNIGGGDTVRDLAITWPDAYTFSSGSVLNPFAMLFAAQSNTVSSYVCEVFIVYNFGSGGTPSDPEYTSLGNVTITPSWQYFPLSIANFPVPSGTFGTNNDHSVSIIIRGPSGSTFNFRVTDFALQFGSDAIPYFPIQTEADMLAEGVAGWMPTPAADGSDLYLPLVLTPKGMTFDDSDIGKIRFSNELTASTTVNELLCNGDGYVASSYSGLGIPYSRLFAKLYDSTNKIPVYGTGANYVTGYVNVGDTAILTLCTNKSGAQTIAANGVGTPISSVNELSASGKTTDFKAGVNNSTLITALCNTVGTPANVLDSGTSTLVAADIYNNASVQYAFNVTAKTAAALAAGAGNPGLYFDFSNTTTRFYLWFQVTTETDPAPFAATAIKCKLDANMTAADVAVAIANCIADFYGQYFTIASAAGITASDYFTYHANAVAYNVWYKKDSSGTSPGGNAIEVDISTGQTAAQVADATRVAINSYSFAVPDLRGVGIRGYDPNLAWDKNAASSRFGQTIIRGGNAIATLELDSIKAHLHATTFSAHIEYVNSNVAGGGTPTYRQDSPGGGTELTLVNPLTGTNESRMVNMNFNFFIKY